MWMLDGMEEKAEKGFTTILQPRNKLRNNRLDKLNNIDYYS